MQSHTDSWPALDYGEWQDSCATLHLMTQIVGKIRLAHAPLVNHWWQVPLYITARGFTTSAMPRGGRNFQIDFDLVDHRLCIDASDGRRDSIPLIPRSVADFYAEFMGRLRALDLETQIWTMPVEIADPIRFEQDRVHTALRLLARQWRLWPPGVLRLRLSPARRLRRRRGRAAGRLLQQGNRRIHPHLRRGPRGRAPARIIARFSRKHLCRRRKSRQLGPPRPGAVDGIAGIAGLSVAVPAGGG